VWQHTYQAQNLLTNRQEEEKKKGNNIQELRIVANQEKSVTKATIFVGFGLANNFWSYNM
jgi:hypothetical protein